MFKHIHSNHFFFFWVSTATKRITYSDSMNNLLEAQKYSLTLFSRLEMLLEIVQENSTFFFFCHCFSKVFIPKKYFCIGILFPLQWWMGGCSYFQSRIVKSFLQLHLSPRKHSWQKPWREEETKTSEPGGHRATCG